MANKSNQTKSVSVRVPNEEVKKLDALADAKGINRSEALLYFWRLGVITEENYKPPTRFQLVMQALRGKK